MDEPCDGHQGGLQINPWHHFWDLKSDGVYRAEAGPARLVPAWCLMACHRAGNMCFASASFYCQAETSATYGPVVGNVNLTIPVSIFFLPYKNIHWNVRDRPSATYFTVLHLKNRLGMHVWPFHWRMIWVLKSHILVAEYREGNCIWHFHDKCNVFFTHKPAINLPEWPLFVKKTFRW